MAKESEETKVGEDKKDVTPPLEDKPKEEPKKEEPKKESLEESPEAKQKAEHLANLRKAVEDEEARLKEIRKNQKKARLGIEIDEEETLPKIDLNDPSSKAWDKHFDKKNAPIQEELEKAKEERRLFTLRQFLSDKPALAKNPEKVKAMMQTYDRLKSSTELTSEGILMDLERAYAAEHSEELVNLARQTRVENAKNDMILSDPAVTKDSTAYSKEQPKPRVYSDEEKAILARWGTTPEQQAEMEAEMRKKA